MHKGTRGFWLAYLVMVAIIAVVTSIPFVEAAWRSAAWKYHAGDLSGANCVQDAIDDLDGRVDSNCYLLPGYISIGSASSNATDLPITGGKVTLGNTGAVSIVAGSINMADLGSSCVGSDEITNSAVGFVDLADNACVSGKIAAGAITLDKLAAGNGVTTNFTCLLTNATFVISNGLIVQVSL